MQSIWVVIIHSLSLVNLAQKHIRANPFNWFSCTNAIKSRWWHFSTEKPPKHYHVRYDFLSISNLCKYNLIGKLLRDQQRRDFVDIFTLLSWSLGLMHRFFLRQTWNFSQFQLFEFDINDFEKKNFIQTKMYLNVLFTWVQCAWTLFGHITKVNVSIRRLFLFIRELLTFYNKYIE